MRDALEILTAIILTVTSVMVFACVLLGARADRLMKRMPVDSDFEEA